MTNVLPLDVSRTAEPITQSVTYIIGTYPLLTTTFIDREIRAIRARGTSVEVVSLRRPTHELSPDQAGLAADTTYIRPVKISAVVRHHAHFAIRRPVRYASTLLRLATGEGQSMRDRARTIGHFGLGVHVAGQLLGGETPDRLHAHFIDRAAVVSLVAARLLDVPYSVTAHASDIYVSPVLLNAKIGGADFVVTCTGYNESHLVREFQEAAGKVTRIYHGLDLDRYEPGEGNDSAPPTILAVGQLREKKGFVHLVDASRALVDAGVAFRCEIIGEGPQRTELEHRIDELGLADHIFLRGALPHNEVIDAYRRASMFVLPSIVGADGDRDGIPNVILEAMAMELPVVSTTNSGIPEAVEHEETGLLVPPSDVTALAAALERLLADRPTAHTMGVRGRAAVVARFDADTNIGALYDRFVGAGAAS